MHISYLTIPLLAPLSSALRSTSNDVPAKRVAVIGAGAGGSSAAYHLSQYAQSADIPTNITVFERNDYIGGRTTTVDAWSSPAHAIELGGSIFVSVNQILVAAAKSFNLSTSASLSSRLSSFTQDNRRVVPELGIWNGREFVLVTKDELGWWDKAKLLWRYGLAPIKTNRLMKKTVAKFLSMYEEPVFPWRSLSEVAAEVDLLGATSVTGEQYLEKNGVGRKFAGEIIQASTRVNYASNLGLIHGLETMVCMAANGAMSIAGGNWQIFAHMLASSVSSLHLETTVSSITKNTDDDTYTLTTSNGLAGTFDSIILAAPYQYTNLSINPEPKHVPNKIPYVALHVTLFASPHELDPSYFGLSADKEVPHFVLTTLPPGENHGSSPDGQGSPGFFSISVVGKGVNPDSTSPKERREYIYKIFSAERVTPAFLGKILGREIASDGKEKEEGNIKVDPNGPVSWIHQKLWHSYPYEYPRVTFEEIKLDEGLWYTSGIESFISTMETSALMGKNVARLVVDEWVADGKDNDKSRPNQSDAEKEKENAIEEEKERLEVGPGVLEEAEWKFAGAANGQEESQAPIRARL